MNKFDELKIKEETAENEEQDLVVSVITPKVEEVKQKTNKVTLFSLFIAAIKPSAVVEPIGRNKPPIPKFTILSLLFVLFFSLLLSVFNYFIEKTILIPLVLLCVSFGVPLVVLVFFHEMNFTHSIGGLKCAILLLFGALLYVLLDSLCNRFLVQFIYQAYIDMFIFPVLWAIGITLLCFMFSNAYKLTCITEYFFVVAAITCGFCIVQSLSVAFSSLFIFTEIKFENGISYNLPVIINETADLNNSIDSMLSNMWSDYILLQFVMPGWAVMLGSSAAFSAKNQKSVTSPLYVVAILSVVFYFLFAVETNFHYFNIILKLVSLCATSLVSIKLINKGLSIDLSTYVS